MVPRSALSESRAAPMQAIDFWKLCDEFSVMHAALIASGKAPEDVEEWSDGNLDRQYPGYIPVRTALYNAIEAGKLKAVIVRHTNDYSDDGPLDVKRTTVAVADLDRFFKAKGFRCEHFERPDATLRPTSDNPYYSKKLEAANRAWAAVTSDPSRLAGKSPKQALERWLTENAADLGLVNKDGRPNRTGIDEICKVANWRPEGGATPTPSASVKALPPAPALIQLPPPKPKSPPKETFPADLDDEIPF
jgi:hypothetical protein